MNPTLLTVVPRCPRKVAPCARSALLVAAATIAMAFPRQGAQAAFHLWTVSEVYSSADGSVQFIELRTTFGSQQFIANQTLRSTNSGGTSSFVFPTNLPSDSANTTFILGTSNLASIPGGVVPNYIIPANFVRPAVGGGNAAVIYNPSGSTIPCTNLPTDGDLSLNNPGGTIVLATNSPRNFNGQSNTIVPLKFGSANLAGTNFVMKFRTATGVNGSAGPNYTVECKDNLTDPSWTTLTSVAGDGTTKSVSNATTTAAQRVFRLRVP